MVHDPETPRRRAMRLAGYDYAEAGAYFLTVCTQGKRCLFGEVVGGEMRLNRPGKIVRETWDGLPRHYPHVELDAFVVMPSHVHGVIVLVGAGLKPALIGELHTDDAKTGLKRAGLKPALIGELHTDDAKTGLKRAGLKPAPTKRHGLPEIVRAFKTFSARRINEMRATPGVRLWQRNYYEHVIRDDAEWNLVREYIVYNPSRWDEDWENPFRQTEEPQG
jgi:REP element-mobilizing transposase RayT